MNCRHCHTPLQPSAHFCPTCGVSTPQSVPPASWEIQTRGLVPPQQASESPVGPTQPIIPHEVWPQTTAGTSISPTPPIPPEAWPQRSSVPPTQPVTSSWVASPQPTQAQPQAWAASENPQPPWSQPGIQPGTYSEPKKKQLTQDANQHERPRRRGRGCLSGCLITLVLLLLLGGTGWYFALRPYIHDIAESHLNNALALAVTQIPEEIALAPSLPVTVRENALNNLIALNIAPSDPIQKPVTQITTKGIRVEFQVYGLPSAISGTPKAEKGKLIATNVSVEGIAMLVMSNEEMTAILNTHLAAAQKRLQHSVASVTLKEDELNLMLEVV